MSFWPGVVVATPAHSSVGGILSYRSESTLTPGTLVRVPLGSRELLGVVWECPAHPPAGLSAAQTRAVIGVLEGLPPLNASWRQLVRFAAQYYQRSLGEVALAALPPQLRELDAAQLARRLKRREQRARAGTDTTAQPQQASAGPALSAEQACALQELTQATDPVLLHGATGSGKTEVYLRATQAVLEQAATEDDSGQRWPTQVLVMVPEINLTPQLEARFRARFEPGFGAGGWSPAQRHDAPAAPGQLAGGPQGNRRIVLGTRMAVFASLPGLRLIVVDEEHDPSYKQQEGARYSARDLAVYRGKLETGAAQGAMVLGSATPSLESWHACRARPLPAAGHARRIGGGALPRLRLVDMNQQPKGWP
jgi:primosomal protein N' (replication factor Y)